jgi:hypothetical protein
MRERFDFCCCQNARSKWIAAHATKLYRARKATVASFRMGYFETLVITTTP